jgi:hypothetical protein
MSNAARRLPEGVTPKKLILIGVLAVILVTVLIVQYGRIGGDSGSAPGVAGPTAARPDPPRQAPPRQAPPTETTSKSPTPETEHPPWPKLTADQVRRHDPFAVSQAMSPWLGPEPVQDVAAPAPIDEAQQRWAAQLQETLNFLKSHGVSLIIDDGSGPTALINNRTFRIGDEIGGFRVVDINAQEGVVLEVKAKEGGVR